MITVSSVAGRYGNVSCRTCLWRNGLLGLLVPAVNYKQIDWKESGRLPEGKRNFHKVCDKPYRMEFRRFCE